MRKYGFLVNEFKYNEITMSFELFRSLGLRPTLMIENREKELAWIVVKVKDTKMASRNYDKKWLFAKIKHYIERAGKYQDGEIRMINKREL